MNKLPSMFWLLIAVIACGPLLAGCGNGENAAGSTDNDPIAPDYMDPPADPNPRVDSEQSWQEFFAKFKSKLKKPAAAQAKWKDTYASGQVKLVLMNSDPEMEYMNFGDSGLVKGVNPKRDYELGVIRLAAKEDKGPDGYQIREYDLKFITPQQDGEWKYAIGYFKISTNKEPASQQITTWLQLPREEFEKSYLNLLFEDPPAESENAGK